MIVFVCVCVCVRGAQAVTSLRPASSNSLSYGSFLLRYAPDPRRTEYYITVNNDSLCVPAG